MTCKKCCCVGAPLAIAALVALGGWVVQTLWNWLIPVIFGGHVIGYWQALGLLVLSRILFGGFCHGRGPRAHFRERWEGMSPEERERFHKGLGRHFCCGKKAEEPAAEQPRS